MKCLVVIAHPLRASLCHALAAKAIATLTAAGHEVVVEDLYADRFDAALTESERASYYAQRHASAAVQAQIDRLLAAEALVLCFPTWWFGFPAILKGWFDRVWAPGVAYDHADDLGRIRARLHGLRRVLAITSLGSPWWVDRLLLRQPVKRVLSKAILATCAPSARCEIISCYNAERLEPVQVGRLSKRVERALARWL